MLSRVLLALSVVSSCLYLIAHPPSGRGRRNPQIRQLLMQDFRQRGGARRSGSLRAREPVNGSIRVRYRWRDVNTRRRAGRRAVERELSLTHEIDRARLKRIIREFGMPQSWGMLRYRTRAELERKQRALVQRAALRGIRVEPAAGSNTGTADHKWIIGKSKSDLKPLAQQLLTITRNNGYTTKRDFVGVVASFVQAMAYKIPKDSRRNESGETILTGGVTMPLETLSNGWGDCDTKSLLFASILANFRGQRIVFLMGNNHLFVGLRAVPRGADRHVDLRGSKYVLIEMSTPHPLGRVPPQNWTDYRRNQFEVKRVF